MSHVNSESHVAPRSARSGAALGGLTGVLVCALFAAPPLEAQPMPGALPQSWMSSWPDGPPATGLKPSLWVDRRGLGFTVGGTLAIDLLQSNGLEPGVTRSDGIVFELGGFGAGSPFAGAPSFGALSGRLHVTRRTGGIWLATSGLKSEDDGRTLPSLGAGVWLQRGRFTFTSQAMQLMSPLRFAQHRQSASSDSGRAAVDLPMNLPVVEDIRRLSGAEASVSWALHRLELQSRVGVAMSVHHPSARWGELGAAYWARPRVAVFARARTAAEIPAALEGVRGSQAALGIQVAPGRTPGPSAIVPSHDDRRFRLSRVGEADRRVTFRVSCNRLEVRSDATGWSAVDAHRMGNDRWELVLGLSPGVHRIEIRIDGGAWGPPPGVPTTDDEFGGEVGLIIVE